MRRRDFVIGGAYVLAPFVARAQSQTTRRVGIVLGAADDNVEFRTRMAAFREEFAKLGWMEGRNVTIDLIWYAGNPQRLATETRDLIRRKPDVILAAPTNALLVVKKETTTIPIVFANVSDPLRHGFIKSLARPEGNLTGFTNLEFSLIGKWLQILKEAAPRTARVGLVISVTNASSADWYDTFRQVAPSFGIEPLPMPVRDQADVERSIRQLTRPATDALIVVGDSLVEVPAVHRLIIQMTSELRLPALYGLLSYATDGGFLCYGIDPIEPYRGAASYVDRLLKGEKTAALPVQQPTKFQFIINLKTAKALGLEPSPTLVAAADQVIE